MASFDRFTLHPMQNYTYPPSGCPVHICCSRQCTETRSGMNFVQIRMQNLTERFIFNVFLSLEAFDEQGQKLYDLRGLVFADCNAEADAFFGEGRMIALPKPVAASLRFCVDCVVFDDGLIWRKNTIYRRQQPCLNEPAPEAPKAEAPAFEVPQAEDLVAVVPQTEEPVAVDPKAEAPAFEVPQTEEPAVVVSKAEASVLEMQQAEESATESVEITPEEITPESLEAIKLELDEIAAQAAEALASALSLLDIKKAEDFSLLTAYEAQAENAETVATETAMQQAKNDVHLNPPAGKKPEPIVRQDEQPSEPAPKKKRGFGLLIWLLIILGVAMAGYALYLLYINGIITIGR